jgi:hypothetical protein
MPPPLLACKTVPNADRIIPHTHHNSSASWLEDVVFYGINFDASNSQHSFCLTLREQKHSLGTQHENSLAFSPLNSGVFLATSVEIKILLDQ